MLGSAVYLSAFGALKEDAQYFHVEAFQRLFHSGISLGGDLRLSEKEVASGHGVG